MSAVFDAEAKRCLIECLTADDAVNVGVEGAQYSIPFEVAKACILAAAETLPTTPSYLRGKP